MKNFVWSVVLLVFASAVLLGTRPGWAHKGEARPTDAATAVRQALAFLDADPPNFGEAAEKAKWAVEAQDQAGVDRAALEQGVEALRAKEADRARTLLRRALASAVGAPAVHSPRDIAGRAVDHRAEAEAHYRQGAPLEALTPRFEGNRGEYTILAVATVLAIGGALVIRRA